MGRKRIASRRGWPPNLGMNADGYFYFVSPRDGKKRGIGRDKAKAFREARAANAALESAAVSTLASRVMGIEQFTLAEWIPKYLEAWVAETSPAKGTLETAKRYLTRVKTADLAAMPLAEITTAHVAKYLDNLDAGITTGVNLRARLQDVFRLAETKGLIETSRNPVTATYVPAYTVKRDRLSLQDFLRIREVVPKWEARAMNLALLTAQRREDVAAMKFSDQRDGYLFITQGKTGMKLQQDVNIRLNAVGLSIKDVLTECRDLILSKYVIHHLRSRSTYRAGDKIGVGTLTSAFSDGRDAVGVTVTEGRTPPTFHEIRSLAERLYLAEYGAEFAQAMLGHKNARQTAEYNDLRGSGWQVVSAK